MSGSTPEITRVGFDAYSVAGGTWARSGRAVVTGTAPGA